MLSFPFPIRLWLLSRPALRQAVLAVVQRVLFGWYARRAAAAGAARGRTGAIVAAQPFGGSPNSNPRSRERPRAEVHFHMLLLDGVYVRCDSGELAFHETRPPSNDDVETLVVEIRHRVERLMRRRGLAEPGQADEAPSLFDLATGQQRRVGELPPRPLRKPPKCAESGFFNLHAGVRVAGRDEEGKERLLRYVLARAAREGLGVEGLLCSCGLLMHVHAVVMGRATEPALSALRGSPAPIRCVLRPDSRTEGLRRHFCAAAPGSHGWSTVQPPF